jgi:hypothetical protein
MRIGLSTFGGVDDNAIKGIAHMRIKLRTRKGNYVRYCVNFLVSNKLNGLEAIIGNKILHNTDLVRSADVFSRKLVRSLPVPLQRNMWGRLPIENDVIAVNSRGEYFYDQGLCKEVGGITICEPEILNNRRIPDACVPDLVSNKGIGSFCLNGKKKFLPLQQEYIYLQSGDEVIIFSPRNDTVTFKCGIVNIPDSKQIALGLNKLTVPKGCYARSSELVIHF